MKDYSQQPHTAVRRKDRAVTDEDWLRRMLHQAAVGTLATVYEGQPFINTNIYVYDEAAHCLYLHTAGTGRTRANIEANPQVCFSVMEMGRLLPADVALEFSVEYAGVTVFGQASIVTDEGEALAALQKLLDKYAPHLTPGTDYRPPTPEENRATTVIRVDIHEWSAKKKEVAPDFAGAFWYADSPMLPSRQ